MGGCKACECTEETGSERVMGAGRAGQEREGVCESERERGRGTSEHALHVMQSVHMALYHAVINT